MFVVVVEVGDLVYGIVSRSHVCGKFAAIIIAQLIMPSKYVNEINSAQDYKTSLIFPSLIYCIYVNMVI